jgi:hypothetical protein
LRQRSSSVANEVKSTGALCWALRNQGKINEHNV